MRDAQGRYVPGHPHENDGRARDETGRYIPKSDLHRVAVISDLHFGSIYQQITRLREFLNYAINDKQCEMILCAGDLSDGLKMREHHEFEIFLHTADDIIDYIATEYPVTGCENSFITGNHDNSLWKQAGIEIGKALAKARSDFRFCGYTKADITIPGGVAVRLYHGSGGCGENRSLRIQKQSLKALEECLAIGRKPPEIFLAGHCHYEAVIHNYYNMFIMSLPCFQGLTPYLMERGMISQVGGVVLEYLADGQGLIGIPKVDYRQYVPIIGDYPATKTINGI